ncbi:MAG TPA: hypothetical protein VFV78_06160 [Vicinamibacterales bacterium]|nr:hypothetical protein [Vicinamibacterales bacterium]
MSTGDDRDLPQHDDHLLKRSLTPAGTVAGEACLDAETLAAWADGSTYMPGADAIEQHLATCARCQAMLAAFAHADVAEPSLPAASLTPAADRPSSVVPFRPAWRWVPIAAGAVAASLVVYLAWPKHVTPQSPRLDQAMASSEPAAQSPPPPAEQQMADAALAKTKPLDTMSTRRAPATSAAKAFPPAKPVPIPAPSAPPEPLRAPVSATPPTAAAATGSVSLATPPPAAATPSPTARPELNMVRAAQEAAPDPAKPRVIAEFGAPTTAQASPTQSLIGRAAGGGGGGGGRGGGGGVAGGLVGTPRAIPRVSWRVLASGQVERSINGGQSWTPVTIAPAVNVVTGAAPSADVCWLIGKGGIVLRSTDGATFRRVTSPDVADLRTVTAIDELQATVTTIDGRTFKTIDGGDHWTEGS